MTMNGRVKLFIAWAALMPVVVLMSLEERSKPLDACVQDGTTHWRSDLARFCEDPETWGFFLAIALFAVLGAAAVVRRSGLGLALAAVLAALAFIIAEGAGTGLSRRAPAAPISPSEQRPSAGEMEPGEIHNFGPFEPE